MKRLEIVDGIPVDQSARATPNIKRFLLEKLAVIRKNRDCINEAAIQHKRNEVLDGYKKAVKFDAIVKRLRDAEKELADAKEALLKTGLTKSGYLMKVETKNRIGDHGYFVKDPDSSYNYTEITKTQAEKIEETLKLVKAVEGEMGVFSDFDQLETRMMLASTVGECMAIVNAVADRDVFKLDTGVLKLEDSKEKK